MSFLKNIKTQEDLIEEAKDQKRKQINQVRDKKETEGFPYLNKMFDSDERSASRIFGAVQAAQAALSSGEPFSIVWTVQDNSEVTMDAAETIGMSVAMAQYSGSLHAYAKSLKDLVDIAADQAELDLIIIDGDWNA